MSQHSALSNSERKEADSNEQEKDDGQMYSRNCAVRKCKENILRPKSGNSYYESAIFSSRFLPWISFFPFLPNTRKLNSSLLLHDHIIIQQVLHSFTS